MKQLIFYTMLLLALGMTACTGGGSETAVSQLDQTNATLTPTAYPTPYPEMAPPESCPLTQRPEPRFEPPEPYPEFPSAGSFWYGTAALWTDLRTGSIWEGLPKSEAGYVNKIALWSESYNQTREEEPEIILSARQLDGQAVVEPHLHGTNAQHPDYGYFMMTGIELPTLGCWEISAEYEEHSVQFVVWVAP